MFKILIAGAALALAAGGGASAATITLYNTGVDASGTPLANDSAEQHYVLVGAGDGLRTATDANGYPMGYWAGDDAQSDWIGPATDGSLDGANDTTYDYRLTFSLAGLDPSQAVITGKWLTDDAGSDILINGQSTGATVGGFGFGVAGSSLRRRGLRRANHPFGPLRP